MDFYTRISDYYNYIFPLNKEQLPFVKSCTSSENSFLDIGCGTGDLAISLSDAYESVSAIDPNEKMLEIAQTGTNNTNIEFIVGGMLDVDSLFVDKTFDTIICFGNTVVHLQNIDEIGLFFKKVKKILLPGGKFLFQIINYDNVLNNKLDKLPTIENDQIKFKRHYHLDSIGKIDFSTLLTIKDTSEEIKNSVKLFPIRKKQIESLLTDAGFKSAIAYSSFKKDSYNENSLPLVYECS